MGHVLALAFNRAPGIDAVYGSDADEIMVLEKGFTRRMRLYMFLAETRLDEVGIFGGTERFYG